MRKQISSASSSQTRVMLSCWDEQATSISHSPFTNSLFQILYSKHMQSRQRGLLSSTQLPYVGHKLYPKHNLLGILVPDCSCPRQSQAIGQMFYNSRNKLGRPELTIATQCPVNGEVVSLWVSCVVLPCLSSGAMVQRFFQGGEAGSKNQEICIPLKGG